MKFKILIRLILLIAVLGGFVFYMTLVFAVDPGDLKEDVSTLLGGQEKIEPPLLSVGRPVRLKIPVINVDSFVEYVGLTPLGAMDAPKAPEDVAWFNLGPRPGEDGSATISGHYGWKDDIPAVFDDLSKLKKGDKIYVEDDKGAIIIFVAREFRVYGEREEASSVFISNDGKSHLNLITCGGGWDKVKKSYPNRLVVFTDKEQYMGN